MAPPSGASPGDGTDLLCSAKGCRRGATRALLWNNPRLHAAARRKVWLTCADHESRLRDFLGARGFLKDTVDVADLGEQHG